MLYVEIFKALNRAKVKYVVAGGVAVVLHGYPRLTQDLDLIVFLEEKNLQSFYGALKALNYSPKVPVTKEQFGDPKQRSQWKKQKGMIVFSFVHKHPPFELVDMFIDEPIEFTQLYKRKSDVRIQGTSVPLIALDDLIKLKKKAGRGKDLDDIVQLKEIKRIRER